MDKLVLWNFEILTMIPSHSLLPLKARHSADQAVSALGLNSSL